MIVPIPAGPSVLGTTRVQRSAIVHVISCATVSTVTLRRTRAVGAAIAASEAATLLKEREGAVEDIGRGLGRAGSDRRGRDTGDDRQRRDVTRHDRSGRDDAAVAEGHPGEDERTGSDPNVLLDHDLARLDAEERVVEPV